MRCEWASSIKEYEYQFAGVFLIEVERGRPKEADKRTEANNTHNELLRCEFLSKLREQRRKAQMPVVVPSRSLYTNISYPKPIAPFDPAALALACQIPRTRFKARVHPVCERERKPSGAAVPSGRLCHHQPNGETGHSTETENGRERASQTRPAAWGPEGWVKAKIMAEP